MAPGAMFGIGNGLTAAVRTKMRSHAHAFVENLDCGRERAHLHRLVNQIIRNAGDVRNVIRLSAISIPLAPRTADCFL